MELKNDTPRRGRPVKVAAQTISLQVVLPKAVADTLRAQAVIQKVSVSERIRQILSIHTSPVSF